MVSRTSGCRSAIALSSSRDTWSWRACRSSRTPETMSLSTVTIVEPSFPPAWSRRASSGWPGFLLACVQLAFLTLGLRSHRLPAVAHHGHHLAHDRADHDKTHADPEHRPVAH